MLSVAQDLVSQLTPYQTALDTALATAARLPLVGDQLADLQEFNSILQNSLSSIETQTQNLTNSGHYDLTVPLPALAKTFTFALGLDAFLQVSTAGAVSAAINPVLNVGFDYQGGVVSLDTVDTNLDLGFNLSLPNFVATMSLNGLLFTRAVDAGTTFQGNLGFDFKPGGGLTADFSGEAHVLMGLTMSFVDPALGASFNPTFRTTLALDWGFGANSQLTAPIIELQNFSLDAGSFMQGFLGDIVATVQKFTKPIQPFIDMFETPVPIVSAFGSSETIGTLMLKGAGQSQEQQDRFALMVKIVKAVNTIDLSGSTGGAVIPFGTIKVTGNAQQTGAFGFDTSLLSGAIDDIFNSPALQAVQDTLEEVGNYTGLTSTAGFQFPLLEDPGPVIGAILTGQTKTMFSFTTGRQHFELAPSVGVGIKDLFGVFLSGGIIFDANLSMGYDTAGLIAVVQDPAHSPAKLLHGFYFDNSIDATAPPIPNHAPVRQTGMYLQGFMALSGSVIATLSGGLNANVDVELVNTDASPHVYLDTMLTNLAGKGRAFRLSGKVYASADISLTVPNPVGPDITLFRYNLAYDELLNFDPPPPPDFSVPVTVIDVTNQHTLLLDANKMGVGSKAVTVQPFYDLPVPNGFIADGIRVDYPNEIYLFVERKNDLTTNYYNLIGLGGTVPDGVSVNVVDPFRVFVDEGAPNPYPAQTKPGVLLVGGKNVVYRYSELGDGTKPSVLLVGGFGSNTLAGGTMTFGNFIPSPRVAQAKAHFADTTGYDGAGQGLINAVIDAAIAPVNPAGIIGATMTGSRGGLMVGGPGNNSFFAAGSGNYEMLGGTWVNSFNMATSFAGGPATYQIDGGPFGQSNLVVRVPLGDTATFENASVPDKYNPQFKALAVLSQAGPSATAHGIQTVKIVASPGSVVEFGDTSEVNVQFSIAGAARVKFSGTPQPDVFSLNVSGAYFAKKNHFTVGDLFTAPSNPGVLLQQNPLVPGVGSTTIPDPDPVFGIPQIYLPTRWSDPVYTVERLFGTNGRTQSIAFSVSDPDASSITLDGKGASDTYNIEQGVGGFLDVTIDDTDATSQNTATVGLRQLDIVYDSARLTDNSLALGFYTLPQVRANIATLMPIRFPQYYQLSGYSDWTNSVFYSPTLFFGSNVDLALKFPIKFQTFVIDRPRAPQSVTIDFGIDGILPKYPDGTSITDNPFGGFLELPLWIYDPDGPSSNIVILGPAPLTTTIRAVSQKPRIDVLNSAGNLTVDLQFTRDASELSVAAVKNMGVNVNVLSNLGVLSFRNLPIFGSGLPNVPNFSTFNVSDNSGTINFNLPELPLLGTPINVLRNAGTINVDNGNGFGTPGVQMRFGDGGSLANVHGTVRLTGVRRVFDVALDDRNNPAGGRKWTIDALHANVGDLSIVFPTNLGGGLGAGFEIRPNAGSTVVFNDQLPGTAPINIFGTGTGNTLIGPVLAGGTNWRIDGVDTGVIRWSPVAILQPRWTNIQSLLGGSGSDAFEFVSGGSLSGGLDGGGGFNTLTYNPPPVPLVVDLANRTAPRVGGQVLNIQSVVPETLTFNAPASLQHAIGNNVNVQLSATSTIGATLSFGASNLPPGLSINPNTGLISGVVTAPLSSLYKASVTVSDGANSRIRTIAWTIAPAQNIAVLANVLGTGVVTITSSAGTQLTATIATNPGVSLPPSVDFPFGFLDFAISGLAAGAATTLTIAGLDTSGIPDYYKYGATPANSTNHWYNFLLGQATDGDSAVGTGMEIVAGNFVLRLIDGGRGDDDLAANGVILDVGGPAIESNVPVNQTPTADAGGPYTISEGDALQLDASASSDPDGDVLSYSWDVNGDGQFGDATGIQPTLTWSQLQALGVNDGPNSVAVRVRVNDGRNGIDEDSATITVNNALPSAAIGGPAGGTYGQSLSYALVGDDPSSFDLAAGFAYLVHWGDGSPDTTVPRTAGNASGLTVNHTFAAAGQFTVEVTGTDKDGSTSAAQSLSVTIDKAHLHVAADNKSKVYGQANPTLTATITGFVGGETLATSGVSGQPSLALAGDGVHVGQYVITVGVGSLTAANYDFPDAELVDGTLSVTPAALRITAENKSKVYGAAIAELTAAYDGFVNGDTPDSLTARPTLATTATAASHVGNYPIAVRGAVDPDYAIDFVDGIFAVTPADLRITAENKSKVYGAALVALTAAYDGLVNGDTADNLTTKPTLATTATAASHVGSYPITASGAVDPDYTIGYAPGTLSVTPAPLTIKADDKSKTVGSPNPPLTFTAIGFVNGDTPASLTTQPTLTTTAVTDSPAGSYPIAASGAASPDYTFGYTPGTLTVTPTTASGAIAGTLYLDVTGNGLSADDTPQSGVKVYLDVNNDATPNNGEPAAITLADGTYAFTNLAAGTYKVREVVPAGYVRTGPASTDVYGVTLATGQTAAGNNFANAAKGDLTALASIVYVINGTSATSDLRGATHEGDTVQVSFTVVAGAQPQRLTLVSYTAAGSTFDPNKAAQQRVFDTDTGLFGPGNYTMNVTIPHSFYQVDFVAGYAIDRLGPANSNIFYTPQNRLFGADNGGTHAVLLSPAALSGSVYHDSNNNGVMDPGERPIAGAKVTLAGGSATQTTLSDAYGVYTFDNLPAGTYAITETQPSQYADGQDTLGNKGGTVANDKFSGIVLAAGTAGAGYNFGEQQTVGTPVAANQTQTAAWWNSSTGQALIKALNGNQNAKNLGNWLAANVGNLFGSDAGSANNLSGKTNAQVASFFKTLYADAAKKTEAEMLALALSVYVTNSNLAGNAAASYGFSVSTTGLGASTLNVGTSGAAFGLDDNAIMTVSELLLRINLRSRKGRLWDVDGSGTLSSAETALRTQAQSLFASINNL